MPLLNTAENIMLGNTQVDAVYQGTHLVWQKPIGFPTALLDKYGRAYDVNMANNCLVTINNPSSNVAVLGERVGCFMPVAENRIDATGATAGTMQSRLNGNTTGPTLATVGGRRALSFNGSTDEFINSATGANTNVFLAATMGALVYTDANTSGVLFSLYRAEYGSNRTTFFIRAQGSSGAWQPYARLDATVMVNNNNSANVGLVTPEGWKVVWYEVNLGTGDGGSGSMYCEVSEDNRSYSFTSSIGADAADGTFSRVTLGGHMAGTSPSDRFNGSVAKFFWAMKTFSAPERATLKQWLRSTKYLDPT